jgi:hypothetical protein
MSSNIGFLEKKLKIKNVARSAMAPEALKKLKKV